MANDVTRRDYFAAHALGALLQAEDFPRKREQGHANEVRAIVAEAFEIADKMCEAAAAPKKQ